MTIDELLDIMDETLEEATTLPFTGGKRMVDVEKVRDIMDDIRLSMPQEIKQARAIVEDRGRIVDDANKEAEAIIKRAEERARAIVAEQAIVKAAQQKATEMLASAQAQSREMRATVTGYCENMLRRTEEQLAQSLTGRENRAHHAAPNFQKRPWGKTPAARRGLRVDRIFLIGYNIN